jgi:tetratricopeptide (TPR) repeat protein
MATDTAAAPLPRTPVDPARNIWQVPAFLAAVTFFVATWQGWILGGPRIRDLIADDIEKLRSSYERVSPDPSELNERLKELAALIEQVQDPVQLPLVHYTLASGYSRLAELTPALDESRGYWLLAYQHFGLVEVEELTDKQEQLKLRFRRAKARAAVGLGPNATDKDIRDQIALIHPSQIPSQLGEEPGDAPRLQAELALRLTPPDIESAKEALSRYLHGGISTPLISQIRAQLLLAELYFRSKQMEAAKEALSFVSEAAPPELIVAKKVLQGRVFMAIEDWSSATREWETLKVMPGLPSALRTTVSYNLGVCKLHRHELDAAAKLLEEAVKGQESPESMAAAVRLAELYLEGSDVQKHAAAADLLERAMKNVASPAELRTNPNITAAELVKVFETGMKTLEGEGAYEPALKAANAYRAIAEAGQDREKRAEILSAWANGLEKSGGEYKSKAADAAREYLALKETQQAVSAQADSLRRAAAMFRLAGNLDAAIATLREASKLKDLPDALVGPMWLDLADALLAAKRTDEVWKVLNEVMATSTPASTATRYWLAHHFAETRQPEFAQLARWLFEQIARQPDISQTEQADQEKALVELADQLIRIRDFAGAEGWLRQQLHAYPNGPQATLGRLLLGVCILQLAQAPAPAGPAPAKALDMRKEALQLFSAVVAEVDAKLKKDGKLVDPFPWLRVQAAIRILQTNLVMRNPQAVISESTDLIERYRGTVEELIVFSLVYHAFKQERDDAKAAKNDNKESQAYRHMLQTRDRMKDIFDQLPVAAFNGSTLEYTREYWEREWFSPDKQR